MSFFVKWADISCLPVRFLRSAASLSAWLSRFLRSTASLSAWLSRFLQWLCAGIFLLMVCFSSSSSAAVKNKTQKWKKQNRNLALAEQKESKARGVILRFYRWPSLKRQKEIERILTERGLKKTKDIKSFKAQLFEWTQGELKPSATEKKTVTQTKLKPSVEAEKACLKLKNLSYVRRCSPDTLLSPGFLQKTKKTKNNGTEAGYSFECKDCKNKSVGTLSQSLKENLNIRTCNLVSHKRELMKGKLSDYWAQELIGSDLLREELKKTPAPDIDNWIAVFDTQNEDHNINVKNLISDEGRHAVLPEIRKKIPFLELRYKSDGRYEYKGGKGYKKALSLYETNYPGDYLFGFKERAPRYINNSMHWGESKDIYEVFEKLSSSLSNTIVVTSSGNRFPQRLDDMESKASKNYNAILVGSFSPSGFVSEFSQSGKEIHILAPSDTWITSAGKKGEYAKFGGTSGAAPLVTGSLAGFEWLSGYHPTAQEAKTLLEKTALPTLHSHEKPQINGAGLLNAYKLAEVAKRLKQKCGDDFSCFKKEILKEETYQFPKDKDLTTDLAKVFPSCSNQEAKPEGLELPSCEKKAEVFKRLRISVLLNPSKESLKVLSCLYREGGFTQNAEALDKLAIALIPEAELRAKMRARIKKQTKKGMPISDNSMRLMLGMGGFEDEFELFRYESALKMADALEEKGLLLLEKVFNTGNRELQKEALYSAFRMGEKALPLMEKGFNTGNRELQKEALYLAREMGKGLLLLEKVFNTRNIELQKQALDSADWIGEKALPLLKRGFNTGNIELQKQALYSARKMGEKALPLLKRGFNTRNIELQKEALDSARWMGEKALPLLKRGFNTGNIELQKTALYSAGQMGEKGLLLLEKVFNTENIELQKQALYSAGQMGEKALPLLKRGFNTENIELQKEALDSARWMGEKGLPLLEKGFNTGNRKLQKEALDSASRMGEKGLPLLKRGFNTNNIELQKEALDSAGRMGEKGLPLLKRGFNTNNIELQESALSSAWRIGEKALPLLERGFNTNNIELQESALSSASWMRKKAVPMLKRVLKNKNLDQQIKEDIKKLLESY